MGGEVDFPAGPESVPPDLTRPTRAYRRHAYLAVAGLLVFVTLYFALAGWFAWTAYRLLSSITGETWLVRGVGGAGAAFLAVFMFKAVIFVRRGKLDDGVIELDRAAHPRLFAFLDRLADEARAPRAHRVFLSPSVNAAVFYNLSIANLILPAKKNLEIGLGLVNVLTIGEVKAVLAHEFGHFAQRSMAVGRWVYMAQQIAGHIIVKRDLLDRGLQVLSNIDLRVAWVGWILRTIVWSIRSLVDSAFRWVVLAQKALSREMELQADLVAVSLTGSDALIHALHRLEAADDAMDRTFAFAAGQARGNKRVADLFAIQTEMLERKRAIIDDPAYGTVPPLPAQPAAHRLFEARLAHPPKMWSSHPPNEVREANAKRIYVAAPLDDRSGWVLFDDPEGVRARVTTEFLDVVTKAAEGPNDPADEAQPPILLSFEASKAVLDEVFDRSFLAPEYRGCYLGRSVVRAVTTVDALYGTEPAADRLVAELDALYPDSLADDVERTETLAEEKAMLAAIQRGILEAPGGVIRHRGVEHRRRVLPDLVMQLEHEVLAATRVVEDHDRRVRTVHLACARTQSQGWVDYLRGLAAALHYADHRKADVTDAFGSLQNVLSIVLADQKVTQTELERLVGEAMDLYTTLKSIWEEARGLELGRPLLAALEFDDTWAGTLGDFDLLPPDTGNMGDWLGVAGSWVHGAGNALSTLSSTALDELLRAEREVATAVRTGEPAREAPEPPRIPPGYRTLVPANERPRQTRLGWWDRFQVADGFVPAFARFAIAGAIVFGVVWAGRSLGGAELTIVNGLSRNVTVMLDDRRIDVDPTSAVEVDVDGGSYDVVARVSDGELERFTASIDDEFGRYVYNIAQAAPLIEWKMLTDHREPIGVPRWHRMTADYVAMASAIERKRLGRSDVILVGITGVHPQIAVDMLGGTVARDSDPVIDAHARWEPPGSPHLVTWLDFASRRKDFAELLASRLARNPDDVATLRAEQDQVDRRDAVCARHRAKAAQRPDDPVWQYLDARCIPIAAVARDRFATLAERWPQDGWINFGAVSGAIEFASFTLAEERLQRARDVLPEHAEAIALRVVKLRRLQGYTGFQDVLVKDAPILEFVRGIEAVSEPANADATLRAMRALHRGRLDDAMRDAAGLPFEHSVLALAACSDGAPGELVTRALAVPVDTLGPAAAACAAGLALRTERDPAPYLAIFQQYNRQFRQFTVALTSVNPKTDALEGFDLELRGYALVMGIAARGAAAPAEWRTYVKAVLFPYELPYLK